MSTEIKRPDCFDFAMGFLGGPENKEIVDYVFLLESELRAARQIIGSASLNAKVVARNVELMKENRALKDKAEWSSPDEAFQFWHDSMVGAGALGFPISKEKLLTMIASLRQDPPDDSDLDSYGPSA